MEPNASGIEPVPRAVETADRLHSAAIHLLRRVRRQDPHSGVSAARLSALSVIVFGGPMSIGDLARAEQVQMPTISRLVASLEHEGMVRREADPHDRRVSLIHATDAGHALLDAARQRRIHDLAAQLTALPDQDLTTLARAAEILEHLPSPPDRP